MPLSAKLFERGVERPSIENRVVRLLHANRERAFTAREITRTVVDTARFETPVDVPADSAEFIDYVLMLATVSSILDSLVDDGALERRIVDDGRGKRSYYRSRAPIEGGSSG